MKIRTSSYGEELALLKGLPAPQPWVFRNNRAKYWPSRFCACSIYLNLSMAGDLNISKVMWKVHELINMTRAWGKEKNLSSRFGRSWVRFLSGTQIFFFVPRSYHVDQLTIHISLPSIKFTIFIHFNVSMSSWHHYQATRKWCHEDIETLSKISFAHFYFEMFIEI